MKTVLLLAYYYPPCNNSASKRSGCMAKYLPRYGWRPLVVSHLWTPENCSYDPGFVRNLPPEALIATVPGDRFRAHPGYRFRAFGIELPKVRYLLSPHKYPWQWTRRAMPALRAVLRDHRVDAIWATDGPSGVHYLADGASREFRMPWVADFRDLFDQFDSRPGPLRRLWTRWRSLLEGRVVKSSSAITTISEGLARLLQARHRRAVHVISNGFDPEDIAERNGAPIPRFNLVFTGIVYREASPRLALDAMASLLRAGEMREEDLSVDFYGWTRPVQEDLVRGYGYPQIVRFHSHVVAEQCAAICRSAAVLLLGGFAGLKGILGGKVFEYLAAQRPILCAPSDHDCMAALLGETNAGASCSTVQEAAARLLEWYKEWKATGTVRYSGKREAILKYSRDRQAEALAQLLNTITSGGAS